MDDYQEKINKYNYSEDQLQNYKDLTVHNNESIIEFAKILFNKSIKELNYNLTLLLLDEYMKTSDIFSMLLELLLYGLHILNIENIFNIEPIDNIVYDVKKYLRSAGININFHEEFINDEPILYRDRDDYYVHIVPRPPFFLCPKGWYVLNYRLIENNKFNILTSLEHFKAFYIFKNNKIVTISFSFLRTL